MFRVDLSYFSAEEIEQAEAHGITLFNSVQACDIYLKILQGYIICKILWLWGRGNGPLGKKEETNKGRREKGWKREGNWWKLMKNWVID